MPRKPKVTLLGLEFVQRLKNAIRDEGSLGDIILSHRIPVGCLDGSRPLTYTLDLAREPRGLIVATCRELPEVMVAADSENAALAKAELEIRHLLAARRSSSPPN